MAFNYDISDCLFSNLNVLWLNVGVIGNRSDGVDMTAIRQRIKLVGTAFVGIACVFKQIQQL